MKLVPGTIIKFCKELEPVHRDKTGDIVRLGDALVAMYVGTEILKINYTKYDFYTEQDINLSDWCLSIKLLWEDKNIYRAIKTFTSLEDAKAFARTGRFHKLVENSYRGLEVEIIIP